MARIHVRIVGGSCGNQMFVIHEHLAALIERAGYDCRLTNQNIWQMPTLPPNVDLVLQLLPAFKEEEIGCPLINIKPLLIDLDHPPTMRKIFEALEQAHQAAPRTPDRAATSGVDDQTPHPPSKSLMEGFRAARDRLWTHK